AMLVSAKADAWGRRPLLLAACAALPLRGLIFAAATDPRLLVLAQVLDGFGGGMLDTLLPLILADIMRGTGRYNLARGILSTVQGIGGSVSNGIAGMLVARAGYGPAFVVLSGAGAGALVLAFRQFVESRPAERG
ncbi:MAG: MFS transporter, partial [Methylobacteriaceae bacterium]|nr:MFS transporter [Methylobacteriaceae bacterium]